MAEDRVILHCDCNSFFASVETALHPAFRNVPMAVCGNEEERHGIVLAKNELAKSFGIQTAETVVSARRKCPSLVIAEPHYEEYVKYSKAVSEIYARFTDAIEPFSIDESWLDVTASKKLFGTGEQIADTIRETVRKEIGITISVGVSFNKVFAKLGSDYKKPDATTVISRENYQKIVYPLPATDMIFVGAHTGEMLRTMGIRTIGDLAAASPDLLVMRLGKMGEMLSRYARGEDDSPVAPRTEARKSISNGFTFIRDLVGREECRQGIEFLCEEIGTKLRRQEMKATVVSLKIKDVFLRTVQKQATLDPPTDLTKEISEAAYCLLCSMWSENKPARMLTVSVSGLLQKEAQTEQLTLFPDETQQKRREKDGKRDVAIDAIRDRFGVSAIQSGASIREDGIFKKK